MMFCRGFVEHTIRYATALTLAYPLTKNRSVATREGRLAITRLIFDNTILIYVCNDSLSTQPMLTAYIVCPSPSRLHVEKEQWYVEAGDIIEDNIRKVYSTFERLCKMELAL